MKEQTKHLKLILPALFSTIVSANATSTPTAPALTMGPASGWFATIQGGALWTNSSDSMTVSNGSPYPPPLNVDHYSVNGNQTSGVIAVLGGYQWRHQGEWIPAYSLALRYQHFFNASLNGVVTQYSLPQFANYNYTWNVDSNLISLYSKIDLFQYGRFTPFFDVGVGAAINHTSDFNETALSGVTPRISPAFQSNSQTSFTYNLGLGVDFAVTSQWSVSVGYDYQYFGAIKSGPGLTTWSADRLSLGNLQGNMVTAGLTYYFDDMSPKYQGK
ncbi:MAG: outer membrane beta-barrel protein [Legionellales bacterium]|nr:outer membrane beta-barrel protein [Legionellales bacterium]